MLFKIWTTEHCFNKIKFILTFIFRHIALRRDHYECAVLFLMRSARLDVKNENGEIPEDCMKVHKNPKCRLIVKVRKERKNLSDVIYNNVYHTPEKCLPRMSPLNFYQAFKLFLLLKNVNICNGR